MSLTPIQYSRAYAALLSSRRSFGSRLRSARSRIRPAVERHPQSEISHPTLAFRTLPSLGENSAGPSGVPIGPGPRFATSAHKELADHLPVPGVGFVGTEEGWDLCTGEERNSYPSAASRGTGFARVVQANSAPSLGWRFRCRNFHRNVHRPDFLAPAVDHSQTQQVRPRFQQ